MNINKTIHEAMGLCWHENVTQVERDTPRWECCNRLMSIDHKVDYTAPVHYCALMDWMREDWLRWYRFEQWMDCCLREYLNKPRQEQITLIAKAIEAGVLK